MNQRLVYIYVDEKKKWTHIKRIPVYLWISLHLALLLLLALLVLLVCFQGRFGQSSKAGNGTQMTSATLLFVFLDILFHSVAVAINRDQPNTIDWITAGKKSNKQDGCIRYTTDSLKYTYLTWIQWTARGFWKVGWLIDTEVNNNNNNANDGEDTMVYTWPNSVYTSLKSMISLPIVFSLLTIADLAFLAFDAFDNSQRTDIDHVLCFFTNQVYLINIVVSLFTLVKWSFWCHLNFNYWRFRKNDHHTSQHYTSRPFVAPWRTWECERLWFLVFLLNTTVIAGLAAYSRLEEPWSKMVCPEMCPTNGTKRVDFLWNNARVHTIPFMGSFMIFTEMITQDPCPELAAKRQELPYRTALHMIFTYAVIPFTYFIYVNWSAQYKITSSKDQESMRLRTTVTILCMAIGGGLVYTFYFAHSHGKFPYLDSRDGNDNLCGPFIESANTSEQHRGDGSNSHTVLSCASRQRRQSKEFKI